MEHIYSSLYDLFNQNFAVFGDKRYCRIALGALLNPKCFVHQNFHCIIFMNDDDEELKKADAPFLNRFEKHYIKLENLLTERDKNVIALLKEWVNKMLRLRVQRDVIQLQPTSIFPNYSNDTLGLIVLKNGEDSLDSEEELATICKIEMLRYATQDIIILAHIAQITEQEKDFIIKNYQEIHNEGFYERIKSTISENQIP